MIVAQDALDADRAGRHTTFLGSLAQGGGHRRLVAVPGAARWSPSAAMLGPAGPVQQQHTRLSGLVMRVNQQASGPVGAPVPVSQAALGPAVAIASGHPDRR